MTNAVVTFEEAVGSSQDTVDLQGYLHLLGSDVHSGNTATSYVNYPEDGALGGTVYSYERWIRARFDPGFVFVQSFRFYAPTLTSLPAGWTFKYGTATSYQAPVNIASTIATANVPTADPGRSNPNAGGASALDGTVTRYSQWIVLQAVIDTATVGGSGPAYGYASDSSPNLIEYDFYWTETE